MTQEAPSIEQQIVDMVSKSVDTAYQIVANLFVCGDPDSMKPFMPIVVSMRQLDEASMQAIAVPVIMAVYETIGIEVDSDEAEVGADLAAVAVSDATTVLMQFVQQQQEQRHRAQAAIATGQPGLIT